MHKGLTKKRDYEKGKSAARARGPDYRDRFAEEGEGFNRGGSPADEVSVKGRRLTGSGVATIRRDEKLEAIEFYQRHLRSVILSVDRWRFRFRITADQFAKENGISIQESERMLPSLKVQADQRLELTLQRARRAQMDAAEVRDSKTGAPRVVWRLRFKAFLSPVQPIEWVKIYKRILLSPTDQECGD